MPLNMDVGGKTQISNLPNEIMEMIFDRLPFRVRQNAKLVCQNWFGILLAERYRKQEKIVVRGFYPVEDILDVLSKCNGRLRYLEFQNVHLDAKKFDSSFWIAHGAQINELRFRNCTTDPETFSCMAVHCVNLESLYWHNEKDSTLMCSSEMLDFLMHINFQHKNLLIFQNDVVSPAHWLHKFRKVFPKVERMSYLEDRHSCTCCGRNNKKEFRGIRFISDGEVDLPKISEKKLSLGFSNLSVDFLQMALVSAYELRRLQEIEINADMKTFPRDEFFHMVRQQPLLEKFKFVAVNITYASNVMFNFGENLLEALFETSEKLRWLFLDLGSPYNLMISAALFQKMKSSQLSYLWLESSELHFDEVLYSKISYENVQKNSTLRHLSVYSCLESVDSRFYLLLQSFSRLEHLETNWLLSNEVLRSIITHQSQLKSLGFRNAKRRPSEEDSDSSHQLCHLGKLKNLKYLLMQFKFRGERLQKDGLAEFQLPSLEYLYVESKFDDLEFFEAWLNELARSSQKLRALRFCNSLVELSFESWLKFCSSLKNLEYLCIQSGSWYGEPRNPLTEERLKELFLASPSLRVIVQTPTSGGTKFYNSAMYDRAREKMFIIRCPTYTIRNSNVDYYQYADWLFF